MNTQNLKKYLAGFSIAGLLAGFGFAVESAADDSAGGKSGSDVTTEQTTPNSGCSGLKATPTSQATPTGA